MLCRRRRHALRLTHTVCGAALIVAASLVAASPAAAGSARSEPTSKALDVRYAFVDAPVAPEYQHSFTLHLHDGIVSRQTDTGVVSVTVPTALLRHLARTAPSLPDGTFTARKGCVGGTTRRLRVRLGDRTLAKANVYRCGKANRSETASLERYVAPLIELTDASAPARRAADIAVAHTPPGGYGDAFPDPVLADCTEPLVGGAPDLRGMWEVVDVEVNGTTAPESHPVHQHVERVEQCGDRLVVTGGGVIHDMRCDGTVEHGVHDVAAADFTTPLSVVTTYEHGVHTLRPVGLPGVEVTRRLDGDEMVWSYVGNFVARLRRTCAPESAPPDA
ncbi:MAG: hypothetical protein MUP97_05445 [Acidimicrobiia bacterium]|nr:hypothetical protein [Acidimicrobiia bacterium]